MSCSYQAAVRERTWRKILAGANWRANCGMDSFELLASPNRAQAASTMLKMFHSAGNGFDSAQYDPLDADYEEDKAVIAPPVECGGEDAGLLGAGGEEYEEEEEEGEEEAHKPLAVRAARRLSLKALKMCRATVAAPLRLLYCCGEAIHASFHCVCLCSC